MSRAPAARRPALLVGGAVLLFAGAVLAGILVGAAGLTARGVLLEIGRAHV